MKILKSLTAPKEANHPDSNEDYFFWAAQGKACAMSDGASDSFDSRSWARILCQSFTQIYNQVSAPQLDDKCVALVLSVARPFFDKQLKAVTTSWSKQLAASRGSFASLLGIIEEPRQVSILAVGDTIALWMDHRQQLRSFILRKSPEFSRNPILLGSETKTDSLLFGSEHSRWGFVTIPKAEMQPRKLFLMTDALGHYMLSQYEKNRPLPLNLLSTMSQTDFQSWVLSQRQSGELHKDDTTFALLSFD